MVKIRRAAILCTFFLLILCSCSSRIDEDFREHPFSCVISFESNGCEMTAKICSGGGGENGLTMEILSPESLSGITVTDKGEIFCGDAKLESDLFAPLFCYAELLTPKGDMKYVTKCRYRDTEALFVTVSSDEGEYELYLQAESFIPLMVCRGELRVEVSDFVYLPERRE